jgi:hypothetical protein
VAKTMRMSDAGGLQVDPVGLLEVAGKGPGPLDDAGFLAGSDWLSNATAITFVPGMERGMDPSHRFRPNFGGRACRQTAPPAAQFLNAGRVGFDNQATGTAIQAKPKWLYL